MPNACDYSSARPDPAALAKAGIVGVVRYATRFGFDKAEHDALLAAGLEVAVVMEWGSQPALRGAAGGTADAREAEAAVGGYYDPGAVIYYVAEDPNRLAQSDWPAVIAYFQAVKAVNPQRKIGAYGSQALVAHLQSLGLVTYGWMVSPWSDVVDGMHLAQMLEAPPAEFTGQIDIDRVLQDDWGQTPRPTNKPAPTSTPTTGDEVTPADLTAIETAVTDIIKSQFSPSWAAYESLKNMVAAEVTVQMGAQIPAIAAAVVKAINAQAPPSVPTVN